MDFNSWQFGVRINYCTYFYYMPISKTIQVDKLEFNYLESGNASDPMIMLLHGFPESSYMWRGLMDELATQGYYCIAPDMRGYSPNACPKGKYEYTISKIASDIVGIAALKQDKFHLIGHDWGAAIGWYLAYNHPDKLISYSALSVPHNSAFTKALKTDSIQKRKSQYMLWFQMPMLPEIYIRRNDFKGFRKLWKRMDPEEIEYNLSIFRNKKCLKGALNYYRANFKGKPEHRIGHIEVPTLFIWGNRDIAISETAAMANHKYMPEDYRFIELDAGHWLIQAAYPEVRDAILDHLKKYSDS